MSKMSDLKNIDGEKYRGGISVYACQSDTTHPTVLMLAKNTKRLTEERFEELTNVPKGTKPLLDSEELRVILETYFGFNKGAYEEHECHAIQKTRMGKTVAGEMRYTGEERTDKDWCSTGLASIEAVEKNKYGSVVTMEVRQGVGELSLDDVVRGSRDDY